MKAPPQGVLRPIPVGGLVVLGAATLLLAACSGAVGAADVTAPTDRATRAARLDVCALVSEAEAGAALRPSVPLTRRLPDHGMLGEPMCLYESADADVTVQVAAPSARLAPFSTATPRGTLPAIPGLGERAAGDDRQVRVQADGVVLTLDDYSGLMRPGTDLSRDQLVALARLFAERL